MLLGTFGDAECFTEKEAEALRQVIITSILFILLSNSHSIIMNFNVDSFLRDFKKWGLNMHTCIGLALGVLTEERLISSF